MKQPNYAQLQTAIDRKGYRFFQQGDFNLNLIGIRSADTRANRFNDHLAVAWRFGGAPHCLVFAATTDPGSYWRQHPVQVNGTAILVPGQYAGLWQLGLHRGQYRALVQRAPARVYRDNNRDRVLDFDGSIEGGLFGINCHRASASHTSQQVDRWSAGCQVLANPLDFALLMALCERAAPHWGSQFTYTLLEASDL
ncbi:hypothetical protein [Microbulbifer spongiae]|uniref:DUF985 domain-containing protein n=1 Tax=Microbulbifer spongiae TaxID=2944933 RepID=A0ABY9E5P7_9GAMM|nr:hypothetical protein [Microbulbifer sp. MI-G]WKD48339.1 hypothetical protein M8T91_10370 [Microbulbifer sp. MI-G]